MLKYLRLCSVLAAMLLLCQAAAFAEGGGQLEITFFNVGAGDCILLRQGEHSMMIDTGYEATEPAVAASLDAMGVKSLDCLLLTHYDEDHVGGAPGLLASFDVGEVYGPDYRGKSREYQNYEAALKTSGVRSTILKKEASFTVGSLDVVLYPPQKRPTALFAFNDLVALGAIRQLQKDGLRLPKDMAIIGATSLDEFRGSLKLLA